MKRLLPFAASGFALVGTFLAFGEEAPHHDPLCPCGATHEDGARTVDDAILLGHVNLQLPEGLPAEFEVGVVIDEKLLRLQLAKSYIYGPNTRFLLQGADGKMTEIDPGEDCSYLGTVAGRPDLSVSAQLTARGLVATVEMEDGSRFHIDPDWEVESTLHTITFSEALTAENLVAPAETTITPLVEEVAEGSLEPQIVDAPEIRTGESSERSTTGGATLPPSRTMQVLEYEVGVEVGSRAFFGGHNGSLSQAMTNVGRIPGNMDRRYLRGAAIKHVLGTVIIRQDASTDPLRDAIRDNGTADLNAFRDYWNNNPDEVGRSHDIAVYHVDFAPSGRAFLNSIGRGDRYAVSCSRGGTSWADGTLVHEFGHSWNLRHNNDAPISVYNFNQNTDLPSRFYEAKPRDNNGRDSAGGNHIYVSVMNGDGRFNIGRLSTEEAATVLSTKSNRSNFGRVVSDPGEVSPFGVMDEARASGQPITIDVIANDYDANNDVLDVELLDTRSHGGGTIALSDGTGPGGRCEIIYTPASGYNGVDFFHYTVRDATGRTDFGAVYVVNDGPTIIDTSLTQYNYDLQNQGGPQQANFDPLTPEIFGDVNWSDPLPRGEDRGQTDGVNNINRDLILTSATTTLNHKLANGTWNVFLNMGDIGRPRDQMRVSAENGQVVRDNLNAAAGEIIGVGFDVAVIDGELNLTFSDEGGVNSAWSATRLSIRLVDSSTDSDNDGLDDALEAQFFGNLSTSDGLPEQDFDEDGVSDRDEFDLGSNPTLTDTDGDGLTDGDEVNNRNTSPTDLDSDGDGFLDGSEVFRNSDPANASSRPDIPSLLVYYPLDEESGTTAVNLGSLGNDLDAEQNQGTIAWVSGGQIAGSGALDLDGASSLMSESPLTNDTTAFTISLWVDPSNINQFTGVYVGRDNPGNWGINLNQTRTDVRFVGSGGGSFGIDSADDSITADGGWYHIVQTWESTGTGSTGAVYLNGALVQTTTAARGDFSLPSLGFFVGDDPNVNGRELEGRVDEIAVFARALSAAEISSVYQTGLAGNTIIDAALDTSGDSDNDGLPDSAEFAAFGNLTSTSGLPTEDFDNDGLSDRFEIESSNTNPAIADTDGDGLTDGAEVNTHGTNPLTRDGDGDDFSDGTEVRYGSDPANANDIPVVPDLLVYYPFDETTGTIANNRGALGNPLDAEQNQGTIGWSTTDLIAGASSLDLDGASSLLAASPFTEQTNAFTISLWVNTDEIKRFVGLYTGRDNPGNWGPNLNFAMVDARFATPTGGSTGLDSADGSVTVDQGWIHVVQTWEGDGTTNFGELFLDGTRVATTTGTSPTFTQPTLGFFIGDDPAVSDRELDGRIDELAVFSRVLTAAEIQSVYTSGQNGNTVLDGLEPPVATPLGRPELVDISFDSSGSSISFNFDTVDGVTYTIFTSTNLTSWMELQTVDGDGNTFSFDSVIDTSSDPKRFYRVESSR